VEVDPELMVGDPGCVVIKGRIEIVAKEESALPAVLLTRTQ
jgi:hypothetical protein